MRPGLLDESIKELTGELLEDRYGLKFRMRGNSMYPLFRDGDTGIVMKCGTGDLRPGDIIVFRSDGNLVAHRLVKRVVMDGATRFIARGDKNSRNDPPLKAEQVIGKIVSVERGGKQKSTGSFMLRAGQLAVRLFGMALVPFFNILLKIKIIRQKIPSAGRSLVANLRFILAGSGRLLSVNLFIAVLQGTLPLAVIFCLKWLIDSLSMIETGDYLSFRPFTWILAVTAFIFLANAIVSATRNYWFEKLSFSVSMHIYKRLHEKHENLEMSYHESAEEQDKIHRAVQEAGFRPVKICNELLQVVRSALAGLVILALFFTIRWYLVLVLLPAILPGVVVRLRHAGRLCRFKRQNSAREREIYYYNRVLTALPFAKELKLFAFGRFFRERFRVAHKLLFGQKNRLNRSVMWHDIIAQGFSVLVVFVVFGYISYLAITGHSTIGTVAMSFLIFHRGYSVLGELSGSAIQLVEDNIFLNDLVDFINLPGKETVARQGESKVQRADEMELKDGKGAEAEKAGEDVTRKGKEMAFPDGPLKKGIFIRDLSFRYKPGQAIVLDRVNLTIPPGKTVAFAGKNGSGKTTMVKLLCGFYRPLSGKIFFDDTDSELLTPETIRGNITAVFQDFALYNLTALENIALGDIDDEISGRYMAKFVVDSGEDILSSAGDIPERVKRAAEDAGISDVIENLPGGYYNMLGTLFRGSNELSIGQWQKFAIARAFFRDSPVLILDEPSSALDAETEMQVLQRLKQLSRDKTVIIVSHRPSTVEWADLLYVFDKGKINEVTGKWKHDARGDLL